MPPPSCWSTWPRSSSTAPARWRSTAAPSPVRRRAGNELENFDNTIVGTGTISNARPRQRRRRRHRRHRRHADPQHRHHDRQRRAAGGDRRPASLDVKDSEIDNSGTGTLGIVIDASSELLVDVASLKLDGSGQVALNGGTITGQRRAGNELENFDNTIVGTGTISNVDLDQRRRRRDRRHRRHADPQHRHHDRQRRAAGGDRVRHPRRQGQARSTTAAPARWAS